jgi:hypothetical protein
MGFRVRKNRQKLLFECYKPPLNSGVKFAESLGNMGNEIYQETEKEYYNVAVVAGMAFDGGRITVEVGEVDATGINRREMYIDARDLQQEENETTDEYKERLMQRGKRRLAEQVKISTTQFEISSEEVKLGDKVKATLSYFNTTVETRITSVKYKSVENQFMKTIGIGQTIFSKRSCLSDYHISFEWYRIRRARCGDISLLKRERSFLG